MTQIFVTVGNQLSYLMKLFFFGLLWASSSFARHPATRVKRLKYASSSSFLLLLRKCFFFLFSLVLLLPLFSGDGACSSSFVRQCFFFLFSPWVVGWFVVVLGCCCGAFVFFVAVVPLVFLIAFEVSESFSLAFQYCIVVF